MGPLLPYTQHELIRGAEWPRWAEGLSLPYYWPSQELITGPNIQWEENLLPTLRNSEAGILGWLPSQP